MIRYTSMTRIGGADAIELGQRALALGVDVFCMWDKRKRYMATARPAGKVGPRLAWAWGRTSSYEAIEAALDQVEAGRFTPDELVTIAAQSGMEVRRA